MALSDCVNCWETPCVCGHEYKNYTFKRRIDLAAAVMGMDQSLLRKALSELVHQDEPSTEIADLEERLAYLYQRQKS